MDAAYRRYIIRTCAFMSAYVLINIAAIVGAFDDVGGMGRWVLGVVVAMPIIGQIWATLALMRDGDEFVRAITAKRFIIAAGLAIAAISAWGYLESYAQAPHAPGWSVYILFWAAFGVVSPFVRTSR